MNKRYVRRRYRRKSHPARPRTRTACPPATNSQADAAGFDELVRARVLKLFGAPLDVVAPDPELREVVYDAVAKGLRKPPRPIPPDVLEEVERLNASGLRVTPGTCDPRDLPMPLDLGWSLSDAIIEYRRAGL
jgi:hypothetical protein